jgi:transposase
MKRLTIADAPTMILALQDEIRRSQEARYDHRLHGILLVAQGKSSAEVAQLLGDSSRTVQYWIRRFEAEGFAGLVEDERSGRPARLNTEQLREIDAALRKAPMEIGLPVNLWDGKTLSAFIRQRFGVDIGVRQCQRLFRQLGFRLRTPRPIIARADAEQQAEFKKNSET